MQVFKAADVVIARLKRRGKDRNVMRCADVDSVLASWESLSGAVLALCGTMLQEHQTIAEVASMHATRSMTDSDALQTILHVVDTSHSSVDCAEAALAKQLASLQIHEQELDLSALSSSEIMVQLKRKAEALDIHLPCDDWPEKHVPTFQRMWTAFCEATIKERSDELTPGYLCLTGIGKVARFDTRNEAFCATQRFTFETLGDIAANYTTHWPDPAVKADPSGRSLDETKATELLLTPPLVGMPDFTGLGAPCSRTPAALAATSTSVSSEARLGRHP